MDDLERFLAILCGILFIFLLFLLFRWSGTCTRFRAFPESIGSSDYEIGYEEARMEIEIRRFDVSEDDVLKETTRGEHTNADEFDRGWSRAWIEFYKERWPENHKRIFE